eukprot:jgi/Botrbrau1/11847/Bobra.0175s0009.1
MLVGAGVKVGRAQEAVLKLAEATGYAVAVTPSGKGQFPEDHPQYVGVYMGMISWVGCQELVESAKGILQVGVVWDDMNTVGFTSVIDPAKTVKVDVSRIYVAGDLTFWPIEMVKALEALANRLERNSVAMETYHRIHLDLRETLLHDPQAPLSVHTCFHALQDLLSNDDQLVVDAGDSWFNAFRLRLPRGCGFEAQLVYASIGWSLGATLGVCIALGHTRRRVINIIGDGAFQMTAQEVSTLARAGVNPIILLINNQGYTIEEELHKGLYNHIAVWDYTAFAQALSAGTPIFTAKARTLADLKQALSEARTAHAERLCLIEVQTEARDCSADLLIFGGRLGAYTGRPPKPV